MDKVLSIVGNQKGECEITYRFGNLKEAVGMIQELKGQHVLLLGFDDLQQEAWLHSPDPHWGNGRLDLDLRDELLPFGTPFIPPNLPDLQLTKLDRSPKSIFFTPPPDPHFRWESRFLESPWMKSPVEESDWLRAFPDPCDDGFTGDPTIDSLHPYKSGGAKQKRPVLPRSKHNKKGRWS